MTAYSWPDRDAYDPDRLRTAWPATVKALPVGARVTGKVTARQPFGVFIGIEGVPDSLGLTEITTVSRDIILPDVGTSIIGEVIWHAEHNHQVKLRPLIFPAATAADLASVATVEGTPVDDVQSLGRNRARSGR
ncbi:hypothetical protein ACWDV4_25675 [Micromonospora sp. NPDC003197]